MTESLGGVLAYVLIPFLGTLMGTIIAVTRPPGARTVSGFQHFAGGVVFAAVAVELLPRLHTLDSPVTMVLGFAVGVAAMLAGKALFENAGVFVPIAVDLLIDGLLVAIGFSTGVMGGMVLLIGMTIGILSMGLSAAPALVSRGMSGVRAVGAMAATGLFIFVGATAGHVVSDVSGALLAGILGFGVAALLYLVTEELLAEGHQESEPPVVTATFFAGFLVPIIIAAV